MNSVVQCTGSTESSRIRVSVNVVAALLVKSNCWIFSLSNLSLTLELKKRPHLDGIDGIEFEELRRTSDHGGTRG